MKNGNSKKQWKVYYIILYLLLKTQNYRVFTYSIALGSMEEPVYQEKFRDKSNQKNEDKKFTNLFKIDIIRTWAQWWNDFKGIEVKWPTNHNFRYFFINYGGGRKR